MQVFAVTVNCSMNGLVELFVLELCGQLQNCRCGVGWAPTGWRGVGGTGHVHPVCIGGRSGFPCPSQAATAYQLMKANFDCANLGATGYGVESGVDELALILWRASQPNMGSGLAGVGSGCLQCLRLYPLLFTPLALSYCSYHKAMATESPLWRRIEHSHVRIFSCPFKTFLLASYSP